MAIKRVAFEFDPFKETGIKVPKENLEEAKELIKDYVLKETLSYVGEAKTPVQGGKYKRGLSSSYKAIKSKTASPIANLELTGAMLDALEVVDGRSKTKLVIQIEGDQAPKADGHNNFSGDSRLPERQFIPNKDDDQTFRKEIWKGIKEILKDLEDDGGSEEA